MTDWLRSWRAGLCLACAATFFTGCNPPILTVIVDYVSGAGAACMPAAGSTFDGPTDFSHAGSALTEVYFGHATDPEVFHSIVSGAPDAGTTGVVFVHSLLADGTLNPSFEVLGAPATGGAFGSALAAADIQPGSGLDVAWGEEIIVGSPGLGGDGTGRVDWFHSDADGWSWGGSHAIPAIGSRYGAAIATATFQSFELVAIGAPGVNEVHLIEATGSSPGLTGTRTVITPPAGSVTSFGERLTFSDFDLDGVPDLVVSAPDSDRVFVFRGDGSGGMPFPDPPLELVGRSGDSYGAGIAAGEIHGGFSGENLLLIGAPTRQTRGFLESGAVCMIHIHGWPANPSGLHSPGRWCTDNTPGGDFEHFGSSIVIGDFSPWDISGGRDSWHSDLQEYAVGAPGFASDTGKVVLYATDDTNYPTFDQMGFIAGTVPGERFGETALATYLKRDVDAELEDLVIGSPFASSSATEQGRVTTTSGALAASTAATGHYTSIDAYSNPVGLEVYDFGPLVVRAQDAMMIEPRVPSGSACVDQNGDAVTISLAPDDALQFYSWNGTSGVFNLDLGFGFLDVTISRTTGSTLLLEIVESGNAWKKLENQNPAGCHIPNNPFVLTPDPTVDICE